MLADAVRHALPSLRHQAESLMTDTCTVTRTVQGGFNDVTGEYDPDVTTELYSGKCRVKPGGGFEVVAGGTERVKHRWTVSVPLTAIGILPDDQVTIDTSELDGDLPGLVLHIVEVPAGSQLTARRLVCEIPR